MSEVQCVKRSWKPYLILGASFLVSCIYCAIIVFCIVSGGYESNNDALELLIALFLDFSFAIIIMLIYMLYYLCTAVELRENRKLRAVFFTLLCTQAILKYLAVWIYWESSREDTMRLVMLLLNN